MITQNLKVKTQNYNLNVKTDLKQRSYNFSVELIRIASELSHTTAGDIVIKQLIRAATSVGANIAEAKSSSSRRDFINFYSYALKSANETKYWLSLLKDACGFSHQKTGHLSSEIDEISRMLGSSIITLKGKNRF